MSKIERITEAQLFVMVS